MSSKKNPVRPFKHSKSRPARYLHPNDPPYGMLNYTMVNLKTRRDRREQLIDESEIMVSDR